MKTNKRTVWFLTLLSLVAVISIYYINKKAPMPFDGIKIFADAGDKTLVEKSWVMVTNKHLCLRKVIYLKKCEWK